MIQCLLKAAKMRLMYQDRCAKVFLCLNAFMLFIGFIWFIGGLVFVGIDIFEAGGDSMHRVLKLMTAFIVIFMLLLTFVSCVGVKLARFIAPSKCQVAAYGIACFLFVLVPFMSFGSSIKVLASISDIEESTMCQTITDVHQHDHSESVSARRRRGKRPGPKKMRRAQAIAMSTFQQFQKLDLKFMMISQKMCSTVCPCAPEIKEMDFLDPISGKVNKINVDVMELYNKISEDELNEHGRTKEKKNGYEPLIFNGTYETFEQCIEDYWDKTDGKDFSEEDMEELFTIDFNPDRNNQNETRPNLYGNTEEAVQDVIKTAMFEFDVAEWLESEFKCLGVCVSPLFYYSLPAGWGRPRETCVSHIRHTIEGPVGTLVDTTFFIGVLGLFNFLLHFSLYGMDKNPPRERHLENVENQNNEQYNDAVAGAMAHGIELEVVGDPGAQPPIEQEENEQAPIDYQEVELESGDKKTGDDVEF